MFWFDFTKYVQKLTEGFTWLGQRGLEALQLLVLAVMVILSAGSHVVAFAFVLGMDIVLGDLLERALRWAWRPRRAKWLVRVVFTVIWLVLWLCGLPFGQALVQTWRVTDDVGTAMGISFIALTLAFVINWRTNPLEAISRLYRRARPLPVVVVPPPAPVYKTYRSAFRGQLNLRVSADAVAVSVAVLHLDETVELAGLTPDVNGYAKATHRVHGIVYVKARRLQEVI